MGTSRPFTKVTLTERQKAVCSEPLQSAVTKNNHGDESTAGTLEAQSDWYSLQELLFNIYMRRKCATVSRGGWILCYSLWIFTSIGKEGIQFIVYTYNDYYSLQSASLLFRILTSSALLLRHIFHHLADSPRGPRRETVSGQIWTSVGHLLPTCPLQDLPLHILKGYKTDGFIYGTKSVTQYPPDSPHSPHIQQ